MSAGSINYTSQLGGVSVINDDLNWIFYKGIEAMNDLIGEIPADLLNIRNGI